MYDCYFKSENGKKCAVLRTKRCKGCSFRKTRDELEAGRRKSIERILSLPAEQRNYLIAKYGLERRVEEYET